MRGQVRWMVLLCACLSEKFVSLGLVKSCSLINGD